MKRLLCIVVGTTITAMICIPGSWGCRNAGASEPCNLLPYYPGVCLDPGHGGPTAGKLREPYTNGLGHNADKGACGWIHEVHDTCLNEVWVNHEIVPLAKDALDAEAVYVASTRQNMSEDLTLTDRCYRANIDPYVDVFISVHHEGLEIVTDTRIWYNNEVSTAEWNYKLAQALANGIDEQFGYGKQAKVGNLYTVLRHARMPAALTEASSLGHLAEAQLMASEDDSHRRAEANGISDGLLIYDDSTSPPYLSCWKSGPQDSGYVFSWNSVPGADGYILVGEEDSQLLTCLDAPTMCIDVGGLTSWTLYYLPFQPGFTVRAYSEYPDPLHPGEVLYFVSGLSDCIGWWTLDTDCFCTAIDRMISSFTAAGGDHQVTLSWHAVSFEEWVEFGIWRSTNGGYSYDDSVGCVDYDRNQDDYTFVDTSTEYGMTYYYKILDTEGYDWWGPASAAPAGGVVPPPPPAPPPILAIDYMDDQVVNVCLEQGSQYADFYNLWLQPEGGSWEGIMHGGDRCVEFGELQNGTPYCFIARAQNQEGMTELSPLVWAVPMTSPTNLHDVAGHQCISLWWDGSSFAVGYKVYYSTTQSDLYQNSVDVGDTTATTLTGLENGTLYFACVVAYDQYSNETVPSNSVSSRPQCWADVTDRENVPTEFGLEGIFPNPFRSSTVISYHIPKACKGVKLVVYDTTGREVRRMVDEGQPAGHYEAGWDGRDSSGRDAPPGVYFCRLEAAGFSRTQKMLLVR